MVPITKSAPKPDHTHSLPEQPMPLEHLSANQAHHVFLFYFPHRVREDRLCAYLGPLSFPLSHPPLPPSTLPPAKIFSSPHFPILFAQSRQQYKPHRRLASSLNTPSNQSLTPLLSDSLFCPDYILLRGGSVCVCWGRCLDWLS